MQGLMHPGGYEITKKAFDVCSLPKSAKVLDIGCGGGDTASYLAREYDLCMTGIDTSKEAISNAKEKYPEIEFIKGDGQFLDFDSLSYDCILMECTLSLIKNPIEAVHEAFCVLKKDGFIIIHDLYLPNPTNDDLDEITQLRDAKQKKSGSDCGDGLSPCTVNGALIMRYIDAVLDEVGFNVILFEDRKTDLDSFAAALIMDGENLEDYCGSQWSREQKSKISYFLLIAQKVEE